MSTPKALGSSTIREAGACLIAASPAIGGRVPESPAGRQAAAHEKGGRSRPPGVPAKPDHLISLDSRTPAWPLVSSISCNCELAANMPIFTSCQT